MTKQDLIEQIANWAGDIQIAVEHQAQETWKSEMLKVATQMAQVVNDESNEPIMISGFGVVA
jgi:nucleoid DNA-binding protein